MTIWAMQLGAGLALDNALVALALAPHLADRAGRLRLLAILAACDAAAAVAGSLLLPGPGAVWLGAAAPLLVVALALGGLWQAFAPARAEPAGLGWWLGSVRRQVLLGVVLGFDNLLGGAQLTSQAALGAAAANAALIVLFGLAGGMLGQGLSPRLRAAGSAATLLLAGVILS